MPEAQGLSLLYLSSWVEVAAGEVIVDGRLPQGTSSLAASPVKILPLPPAEPLVCSACCTMAMSPASTALGSAHTSTTERINDASFTNDNNNNSNDKNLGFCPHASHIMQSWWSSGRKVDWHSLLSHDSTHHSFHDCLSQAASH